MKESRAKRLSDLQPFGDSWLYFYAFMAIGATAGTLLGWAIGAPRHGSGLGTLLGLLVWLGMVIAAHRELTSYRGEHLKSARLPDEHDS